MLHETLITQRIEGVRVHDFRYALAVISVVSIDAIGATLGHKDIRTTLRYAHLKDQTLRNVVGAVSASVLKALEIAAFTSGRNYPATGRDTVSRLRGYSIIGAVPYSSALAIAIRICSTLSVLRFL